MNSIIDDLLGSGLRILLLGSYDDETKDIMYQLRTEINEKFQRYSSSVILLENIDIYIPLEPGLHNYTLFFENETNGGVMTIITDKTTPIEKVSFANSEEFANSLGATGNAINFNQFRKLSELEKLSFLNEWSDLVYVLKNLELTRGGELVELTYLLLNSFGKTMADPRKFEFFYKKEIPISTMIQEIITNNKISPKSYTTYDELKKHTFEITKNHISRLNTEINRFNQFE